MGHKTLKVLLVWALFILAWEGAWRAAQWRAWIFPAPSHVLDATTAMLNLNTSFGEPLRSGWPLRPHDADEEDDAETPSPTAAAKPAKHVWNSPLVEAVATSGVRLLVGFSIAVAMGSFLGLLIWRLPFMDALLGPLFLGFQTLPSVCWVPLAILTLGINERGVLAVLVAGCVFAVAISLRDGLRTLPPIYITAGRMLGARRYTLYRYILMPASLPALAGMLRQGFSFAWRSLMGAELIMLVTRRGLGFQLNVGRDFSDVAQVIAVMIVMVGLGMATDKWVFAPFEKRVRTRFGLIGTR